MGFRTMTLLAGVAVTLGACNKPAPPAADVANTAVDTNTAVDANAADAADSAPAVAPAQAFVNTAAASDAFETATSKIAETNASGAATKRFAKQMITAHAESTAKLKTVVAGLTPPLTPDPTLTPEQQQKLDSLKAESGAAFDTAYAAVQVDAHQATLDVLRAYAAGGDTPALKTFAAGLAPTVAAHLNMAKALQP